MFLKKNKHDSTNNNQKPTKIIVPENLLAAEAYDLAKKFLDLAEAKILICHLTGLSPTNLITHGSDDNYRLEKSQTKLLKNALQRRQKKEPLAYILGETEFFGFKFKVNKSVLIPRQETEDLLNLCVKKIQEKIDDERINPQDIKILELGTGSGILSICLRQIFPKIIIHSTDISGKALKVAKINEDYVKEQNAENLENLENLENYQQIQFFKGSWFKAILDKSLWKNLLAKMQPENSNNQFSRYDLILANPPYIAENSEFLQNLTFEPQTALVAKEDGIADIKNIVENAPIFLKANGWLMFEHGHDQGKISQVLLAKNGFEKIFTHNDLSDLPRVSGGKMPIIE